MHLALKDQTVSLQGLSFHMVGALYVVMSVWRKHGLQSVVITSANDSQHMKTSLHYLGRAIDVRSRFLPDVIGMVDELRTRIGPDFDVVIEKDHIHIEHDPK